MLELLMLRRQHQRGRRLDDDGSGHPWVMLVAGSQPDWQSSRKEGRSLLEAKCGMLSRRSIKSKLAEEQSDYDEEDYQNQVREKKKTPPTGKGSK